MTSNFAGSEGNEKFVARGERTDTWHELGIYPGRKIGTVAESFALARINEIRVDKWPLMAVPPAELRSLAGVTPALSGAVQLVRRPIDGDDKWRPFGSPVSMDYGVLQPEDLATILQPLADRFDGVDTAGALGKGETIFVCFNGGEGTLPGHENERLLHYYVVADHKTGDRATTALYSPVRVVCSNTLAMAKSAAVFTIKMPHRASIQADLQWTTQFLLDAHSAQERTLAMFARLANTSLPIDELREIIKAGYPDPKKPVKVERELAVSANGELTREDVKSLMEQWQREMERTQKARARVEELLQHENDTASDIANSPYAVVNAVAEYEQFTIGQRQTARSVATSAMFGDAAKAQTRAYNKAVELVGAGA